MKIGQRLHRAMKRAGLSQKEISRRTGIHETTISKVMKGETRSPNWQTIETIVDAIDTTWGDLFEEPRIHLSLKDTALAAEFKDFLDRLLANDAAQKERRPVSLVDEIRDAPGIDEVVELTGEKIPGPYVIKGARPFRVLTDSMIEAGVMKGAVIWAQPAMDLNAADGRISIVRVNKTLLVKHVDRRGQQTVLSSANPRYGDIQIRGQKCELVGIVIGVG